MSRITTVLGLSIILALPLQGCDDGEITAASEKPVRPQAALASDATSIALIYPDHNGYWWDHTDLTVAVRAAPNLDPARLAAIRQAIVTWNDFLQDEFEGLISLTDVTDSKKASKADITLHYVPHAGGVVFAGYAICGAKDCPNILVGSHFANYPGYSPKLVHDITMHELGHALGLGHAEPIMTTSDLMGYGWYFNFFPYVLSSCDVKALQAVFQWAVDGAAPHPPTVTSVQC
jgi:hypothetical protein